MCVPGSKKCYKWKKREGKMDKLLFQYGSPLKEINLWLQSDENGAGRGGVEGGHWGLIYDALETEAVGGS